MQKICEDCDRPLSDRPFYYIGLDECGRMRRYRSLKPDRRRDGIRDNCRDCARIWDKWEREQ